MSAVISVAILAVTFTIVPHFAIRSSPNSKVPVPVRMVVYIEAVYGIAHVLFVPTLLLPSMLESVPFNSGEFIFALTVFVGMVWLVIAVNLQHGDRKSRNTLIIFSLVRALNVPLGLPLSSATALLLVLPKKSRQFFRQEGRIDAGSHGDAAH